MFSASLPFHFVPPVRRRRARRRSKDPTSLTHSYSEPSGAPTIIPLYGVKVKIRRADQKKAHWELYSDHNGEFAQRVPAGQADYLVWADLKGYKSPGGKELHQTARSKSTWIMTNVKMSVCI